MIGVRNKSSRDGRERATIELPENGWLILSWPAPSGRGSSASSFTESKELTSMPIHHGDSKVIHTHLTGKLFGIGCCGLHSGDGHRPDPVIDPLFGVVMHGGEGAHQSAILQLKLPA